MTQKTNSAFENNIFKNKIVLVTGGTGSIGTEIVNQLIKLDVKTVRVFCNDENGLFNLQQKLHSKKNIRFLFGDVRDKDRLRMACESVDVIFHAAALKHVPICEYNPFEAIRTNVMGTQNLIEAALLENVGRFTFISTDKAVNPTSTMGASKLLCEKLVIEACSYKGRRRTKFSCVRFGNVLGSRGSVTEVFTRQIQTGEPVTITHPEMTRFVMLLPQAVGLVFKATQSAKGGETFILKMPSLRIVDLAEVMMEDTTAKQHEPDIKITGIRVGEKLHEELMSAHELRNSAETEDMFIVYPPSKIVPQTANKMNGLNVYASNNSHLLSKSEIKGLLKQMNII